MIRMLAVIPYPIGRAPGQRQRIERWALFLRQKGVPVTLSPFLSERGMDVLYDPGRALALTGMERAATCPSPARGFDFDDAIYLAATRPANVWICRLKAPVKTAAMQPGGPRHRCGNEFLAEFARRPASRVTVIRSAFATPRSTRCDQGAAIGCR
jgi:hypothetical protein